MLIVFWALVKLTAAALVILTIFILFCCVIGRP